MSRPEWRAPRRPPHLSTIVESGSWKSLSCVVRVTTAHFAVQRDSQPWSCGQLSTRVLGEDSCTVPRGESRQFREQAVGLHAGVSAALSDGRGMLLGRSDVACCHARCRGELERAFESAARLVPSGHFVDARRRPASDCQDRATQAAHAGRRTPRRAIHAPRGARADRPIRRLPVTAAGDARPHIELWHFVAGAIGEVGHAHAHHERVVAADARRQFECRPA